MRHRDDEWRPFFGETAEPYGAPMPPQKPEPRRGTYDVRRQWKLDVGLCPMPGCGGTVDEEFFCSMCGTVSLPERTEA